MNRFKKPSLNKTKQPRYTKKKVFIFAAVAVLLIAAMLVVLEATNTTNFFDSKDKNLTTAKPSDSRTVNEHTKGEGTTPNTGTKTDQPANNAPGYGEDKESNNAGSSDEPLVKPTGTFVSNHHPNLSGSPAPNQIQSTCTTTPGATCQIIFTKGAETKSLPAQTTDKGGSSYWSWKLQDIGLTEGSWEVTAKAVLNNQTKTATDSLKLEVSK